MALLLRWWSRTTTTLLVVVWSLAAVVAREEVEEAVAALGAAHPAASLGEWVAASAERDWLTTAQSAAQLECLSTERQGNCLETARDHDDHHQPDRHTNNKILNAADALAGRVDWAWRSARPRYAAYDGSREALVAAMAKRPSLRFVVAGDSVARQFAKTLDCLFQHKELPAAVHYCQALGGANSLRRCGLPNLLRPTDVLIVNLGHHVDPSKGPHMRLPDQEGRPHWESLFTVARDAYLRILGDLARNGRVGHVFFLSTIPRFDDRGDNDWDTGGSRACGTTAPSSDAEWANFGGKYPSQPRQNGLLFQGLDREPAVSLLDVASLTLARADAAFDCTHLCLPGPMDTWASILLNRLFGSPAGPPAGDPPGT